MTRRCIIEGCNSKSGNPQHRGVTFHSFPFDSKTREVWLLNCRINPEKNITKSVLVCSRHFRRADFQPVKSSKYLLKQGSVPTIFPWGKIAYVQPTAVTATAVTEASPVAMQQAEVSETLTGDESAHVLSMEVDDVPDKTALKRSSDDSMAGSDVKMPKLSSPIFAAASPPQEIQNSVPISTTPAVPGGRKSEAASGFVPGVRLEAQDFDGVWHVARVVEVDNDEREVLIRFEKTGKSKGLSGAEEWIPMNSSRLRQKASTATKSPNVFILGEKCLARWSGARRFPATIHKVLGNDSYEILFDDGYMKVLKSAHISKMKIPVSKAESPSVVATSPPITPKPAPTHNTSKSKGQLAKKDWPLISMSSLDLAELDLPDIPKDGEWCCHWVNDQPIGREGFLTVGDHKKPTVVVDDWRLPPGWTKHMYQRSNVLGKWDVILVNSNAKRFRSKSDLKQFVEDLGQQYNPDVYDFSIHRRRAKDIGAYAYTKDYKVPQPAHLAKAATSTSIDSPPVLQPQTPVQNLNETEPILTETPTSFDAAPAVKATEEEDQPLEDGYVYVGSLKVQIVENLFRCPKEGCNKNFRKENHLQIHVKHYHDDIAKLLGVCPNMQDLACKRTIGSHPSEEPLPKNHLPNSQFFAKLHQQELQTKMHRKSISTPITPTISTPPYHSIPDSPLISGIIEDSPMKILDSTEMATSVADSLPPTSPPAATAFLHSTGDALETIIPAEEPLKPQPAPKSSRKSTGDRKSSRQRLQKKYLSSNSSRVFDTSFQLTDFEETRHSFNGTPENKITKKAKLSHPTFVQDSNLDGGNTTGSAPEQTPSQSPKYIQENGEVIKIVRMRSEEIINCLCSFGEEDGLMIQCELCLCWQHGICNGIEKESQVPEKYVCYICKNPLLGRASMKYIHDQDWLYEGKLQSGSYHCQNPKLAERFSTLRSSHQLTGNLIELKKYLHSLRVKINIAENKDHPKMYLWAKKWESSPPPRKELKVEKIEPVDSVNVGFNDQVDEKKEILADICKHDCDEPKTEDENKAESGGGVTEANQKITDPITKEAHATSMKQKPNTTHPKQDVNFNQPTIPQPEAAIDPVECQSRLLEHIQKQQTCVSDRLHDIESHIIDLESIDPCNDLDTADYSKTKQTLSILIKDLELMRNIAKINTVPPTYTALT